MTNKKVTIVNYGLGNIGSVQKALKRIGYDCIITDEKQNIKNATALILPGVGHFKTGIENIKQLNLFDTLNELVNTKKIPILGICLGMQLMTRFSEEGSCEGFNWIEAETKKFNFGQNAGNLKIPHIGWNSLEVLNNSTLLDGLTDSSFYYFVHSYFVDCTNPKDVVAYTNYGQRIVSVFAKDNIFGCQFHPEKSHEAGLKLLKNFLELC